MSFQESVTGTATWNGEVIAHSNQCVIVEGNLYFPRTDVRMEYFTLTDHHTTCSWKGTCNYYTVTVEGKSNVNCSWFYPHPEPAAEKITDMIAFWKGVVVKRG